ncbi:MAG: hypothetical protein H6577_00635 [Lewinellaceae bacterium]|nr:hypothetical protein [Saprospiraceae bacterium]MCB9336613.1 hypothetical protein [Lewinellaceae bacterium]
MKTLTLLITVLFLAIFQQAFGQEPTFPSDTSKNKQNSPLLKSYVLETEEPMSLGTYPSLTVILEITDEKLAQKVWKDFMKDYGGKTKKMKGGKEDLTSGAEIVGVNGVNTLDIYSKANTGVDGNVEYTVWFNLGDEYLSSRRKAQYEEAEKLLLKFALETKKEQTKNELEDAEKKLKSLDNDLGKLQRQKDNYQKTIEDAEKRIQQAKEDIVTNEQQQADTSQKIDLQKELVEEIKRRLGELRKN